MTSIIVACFTFGISERRSWLKITEWPIARKRPGSQLPGLAR
ncbi:hypothetical protein SAMN05421630_11353 [Prauserella marina]|uniref:Uncharacterized protein n=1 Tax=Prauserella marina TaxID=530584 RepID=A0A1G6XZZ8_9PSEU|nr:hypothetical protein DES30_103164 [Prauserella marina]SDD83784.1 hypothetical protein SAMN05421630_11353 [Prauserella marina]